MFQLSSLRAIRVSSRVALRFLYVNSMVYKIKLLAANPNPCLRNLLLYSSVSFPIKAEKLKLDSYLRDHAATILNICCTVFSDSCFRLQGECLKHTEPFQLSNWVWKWKQLIYTVLSKSSQKTQLLKLMPYNFLWWICT